MCPLLGIHISPQQSASKLSSQDICFDRAHISASLLACTLTHNSVPALTCLLQLHAARRRRRRGLRCLLTPAGCIAGAGAEPLAPLCAAAWVGTAGELGASSDWSASSGSCPASELVAACSDAMELAEPEPGSAVACGDESSSCALLLGVCELPECAACKEPRPGPKALGLPGSLAAPGCLAMMPAWFARATSTDCWRCTCSAATRAAAA